MVIVDQLERKQWWDFVQRHPKGSIFHTPYMFDVFVHTRRHCPLMLAAIDGSGEVLALLTSVCVQTLPGPIAKFASRSILYAEPLCRGDREGLNALAAVLREHDRCIGRRVLFAEVRPVCPSTGDQTALIQCGYSREDYLNFVIDLQCSIDKLWSRLTSFCRANIRRGQKKGVCIEEDTSEAGVNGLYGILRRTYERARVPLADRTLFLNAVRILAPAGLFKVFIARCAGTIVGASAVLLYKKVLYEWYWGADRLKSVYAAECVTWDRIAWGQQHGYRWYDFGGAGSPGQVYGVRDFKAKFGGELVNYGRYRKVYSQWRLRLASELYEITRRSLYNRLWRPA